MKGLPADAALEVKELEIAYGGAEPAIRGIDLTVAPGELVAVVGANGAGKTTLMQGIAGLLPVRAGRVALMGEDITKLPAHKRTVAGLSLALEGHEIVGELSVEDNLLLTLFPSWPRIGRREMKSRTSRAYEMFPFLYDRRKQSAGTLSGGQQQMLAIGRLLTAGAEVLLLDEPSLGLAPSIAKDVYEHLNVLRRQGKAIVVVEQNASLAGALSDRAYLLRLGEVVGVTEGDLTREELQKAYL